MIKIEFTPEEIDALEHERYHHPDPKVQKKMEVLYLKSQNKLRYERVITQVSHKLIGQIPNYLLC